MPVHGRSRDGVCIGSHVTAISTEKMHMTAGRGDIGAHAVGQVRPARGRGAARGPERLGPPNEAGALPISPAARCRCAAHLPRRTMQVRCPSPPPHEAGALPISPAA
jgi:hypothetical protein